MIQSGVVPLKRGHFTLLVAAAVVIALALAGCDSNTTFVPVSDPSTTVATYVGNDVTTDGTGTCASCHNDISKEYFPVATGHGMNFIPLRQSPSNAGCAPCHSTGFQKPSGFVNMATMPQLANIQCEECHGPASKHVANPSASNISKVPDAKNTCWNCHASPYRLMETNPGAKTDADLYGAKPPTSVHLYQAPLLAGVLGYNRTGEPGPHAFVENTCATCHMQPKEVANTSGVGTHVAHDPTWPQVDFNACTSCHADGEQLVEEEQADITAKLITLGGEDPANPGKPSPTASGGLLGAFATANSIDPTGNANPDSAAMKAYKGAKYNYFYVNGEGSMGVHNPDFAKRMLDDAITLMTPAP